MRSVGELGEALPSLGQVHVWLLDLSAVSTDLLSNCQKLLSLEERERAQRFKVEHARTQFIAARALVRTCLARYTGEQAEAWRFAYNEYGKPHIANSPFVHIQFNLSHTDGLIACAFSQGFTIGLDVERIRHEIDSLTLARSVLAKQERASLTSLSSQECLKRFFDYWTLKEAFIKAKGIGLSMPLTDFWFELGGDYPQIIFASEPENRKATWQFRQFAPTSSHRMAIAAHLDSSELDVLCRWSLPQFDEYIFTYA